MSTDYKETIQQKRLAQKLAREAQAASGTQSAMLRQLQAIEQTTRTTGQQKPEP